MKFRKKTSGLLKLTVAGLAVSILLSGCGNENSVEDNNATEAPTVTATFNATEKATDNTQPTAQLETLPVTTEGIAPTEIQTMAIEISTETLYNQYAAQATTVASTEEATQPTTNSISLFERLITKSGCSLQ